MLTINIGGDAYPVQETVHRVARRSAMRVVGVALTDLRMTVIDNMLYVTIRKHAKEWESPQTMK